MKTYKLYFSALMLALLTMLYSCDDDLYQVCLLYTSPSPRDS